LISDEWMYVLAGGQRDILTRRLERLWRKLEPLAVSKMPLDVPPLRSTRFGSPLVLSRVHWRGPNSSLRSNS
jgi:hypothetical protein